MAEKKRKPRSDGKKNLGKVARAAINNPSGSVRELAKKAGVSKSTAASKLDKLGQINADPRIKEITDKDLEIVKLGQEIIEGKLKNKLYIKFAKASEISQVISENTKRYILLKPDDGKDPNNQKSFNIHFD